MGWLLHQLSFALRISMTCISLSSLISQLAAYNSLHCKAALQRTTLGTWRPPHLKAKPDIAGAPDEAGSLYVKEKHVIHPVPDCTCGSLALQLDVVKAQLP